MRNGVVLPCSYKFPCQGYLDQSNKKQAVLFLTRFTKGSLAIKLVARRFPELLETQKSHTMKK